MKEKLGRMQHWQNTNQRAKNATWRFLGRNPENAMQHRIMNEEGTHAETNH